MSKINLFLKLHENLSLTFSVILPTDIKMAEKNSTPQKMAEAISYVSTFAARQGTYRANTTVYLSCVGALFVWVLACSHLQHTHAERVNVNTLIVFFLVHFWRHKLWCTF